MQKQRMRIITLVAFLFLSFRLHAEIHPVLFKNDLELYSKVYFGMEYDEFQSILRNRISECTGFKDKDLGKNLKKCTLDTNVRKLDLGQLDFIVVFDNAKLIEVNGQIDSDRYDSLNSTLADLFKAMPQIVTKKNGIFNPYPDYYSVWYFPGYFLGVAKENRKEKGKYYSYVSESSSARSEKIRKQIEKSSGSSFYEMDTTVDLTNLHQTILATDAEKNNSPTVSQQTNPNNGDAITYSGGYVPDANSSNGLKTARINSASNGENAVAPQTNTSTTATSQPNTVSSRPVNKPAQETTSNNPKIADRSMLPSNLSYRATKEQLKGEVIFCSSSDKFFKDFRKSFPKYPIDEYCVGSNLINDIQADTLFLLKDGVVKSVIHRAKDDEFRKLSLMYKETIGNEPKNKKSYKGVIPIDCFSDDGLTDYAEFCKQDGHGFELVTEDAGAVNPAILNRAKLIALVKAVSKTPPDTQPLKGNLPAAKIKDKQNSIATAEQGNSKKSETISLRSRKWDQEPKSFMGIELQKPLNTSINGCTQSSNEICYSVHKVSDSTFLKILQSPIKQFHSIYIKTMGALDTDPGFPVGRIEASFNTDEYNQVRDVLIQKYGEPHNEDVSKVKTVGGAEFNNYESYWYGNDVILTLDSLTTRGYDSGKYGRNFYSYGTLILTTKGYLDQKIDEKSKNTNTEADKL